MRRFPVLLLVTSLALTACSSSLGGLPHYNSPPAAVQLIDSAYDILTNDYVMPLDPTVLGLAAATGMRDAVVQQEGAASGSSFPFATFSGDAIDVRQEIAEQYAKVVTRYPTINMATLAHDAMASMTRSVNDCHTNFFTPSEYRDQEAAIQGTQQFGGIGASLKDRPGGSPLIGEVFAGLPAAKAGLHPGDAIVRVDDKDVSGLSASDVVALIRGPVGTVVHLDVERAGSGLLHFAITRQDVTPPAMSAGTLTDPTNGSVIGYAHLYDFTPDMPQELASVLQQFQQRKATLWILDLRDNSGGTVASLTDAASLFLPQGPFAKLETRSGQAHTLDATGQAVPAPKRLVMIVNDGTASASEIMAAAFQEQGIATLVGQRTAGCVALGEMHPLADGSAIEYAADKVTTAHGTVLNGEGVSPDVVVPMTLDDLAAGKDPQLGAAEAVLDGRLSPSTSGAAPAPAPTAGTTSPKVLPGSTGS